MKIGFVIYAGMSTLDFAGVYEPLTCLKTMEFVPALEWDFCGREEKVTDHTGLTLCATAVGKSFGAYDLMVVPGGSTARKLAKELSFVEWLKTAASCPLKVSVSSGALLLGAAGFLKGKKATTHAASMDELSAYCSEVLDKRIVDEGDVITCGGAASSIDLGLYLCGKLAGLSVKETIRHRMDYHASW